MLLDRPFMLAEVLALVDDHRIEAAVIPERARLRSEPRHPVPELRLVALRFIEPAPAQPFQGEPPDGRDKR